MPNPATTANEPKIAGVLDKASDGISVTEAAKHLGVNRQTIANWIRAGKLPATTFGDTIIRIDPEDLEKLRKPA